MVATSPDMATRTYSATLSGVDGQIVEVEAAIHATLPQIHITGLPGDIVKESRERVRGCLGNLGFAVPSARVIIHLSPATAKKQGSQFDVAVALSVLSVEGLIKNDRLSHTAFIGELTLNGNVKSVPAIVNLVEALIQKPEVERVVVPREAMEELSLLQSSKLRSVAHLSEAIDYVQGNSELLVEEVVTPPRTVRESSLTLDEVLGQDTAKRAIQISLAGGHHLLMIGSPGVGKSLLASIAPTLLPEATTAEWIQIVKNFGHHSAELPSYRNRPFRAPHHTISASGMLGGGSGVVIPGEVTLADRGVLFLDEFAEFRKDVVEGLREPLQEGRIHIHRIGKAISLPANFVLIAATNPCPCGYALDNYRRCRCSSDKINKYQKKLSGPILDRIDLTVTMEKGGVDSKAPWRHNRVESSIRQAWKIQNDRFQNSVTRNNTIALKRDYSPFVLAPTAGEWFERQLSLQELSYRSLFKILRVAQTISDLSATPSIEVDHLLEAKRFKCNGVSLFR